MFRIFLSLSSLRAAGCGICILMLVAGMTRGGAWVFGRDIRGADVILGPQVHLWKDAPDGLSGLEISSQGRSLLAVQDTGALIEADVQRGSDDQITALHNVTRTPVKLASGQLPPRFKWDLEGLAGLPDGQLALAFEGYARVEILAAPGMRPTRTHKWDRFEDHWGNTAFEAVTPLQDGRLMALWENPAEPVQLYDGSRWRSGPVLPIARGYRVTGADLGPDGCLYILSRRFGVIGGFRFRIERYAHPGDTNPQLIYQSAPARLGNAEGLTAWQNAAGIQQLTLVTDNGGPLPVPTRLIEFSVRSGTCAP